MWNSRRLVSIGMLAGTLAFSAGCWKAEKTDDVSNANFMVDKGDVKYTPASRNVDTKWRIPLADTYVFRACVIDRMQRRAAIRQRFDVVDDDGRTIAANRETDPAGCLEWSEQIPFNYFANEPRSVVIERQIVGAPNSTMRGSRAAIYVINPWSPHRGERIDNVFFNNESALQDYVIQNNVARGRDVVRSTLEASNFVVMGDGSTADHRSQLEINNLRAHITKAADHPVEERPLDASVTTLAVNGPRGEGMGAQLEMDLEFEPVVLVKDSRGIDFPMRVRQGRFIVYARIIGVNQGESSNESMFMTPPIPVQTAIYRSADFTARTVLRTTLTSQIRRGRIMLAVKVVPTEGPNLRPFEGVYLLGEFSQLRGKTSPTLRNTNGADFQGQMGFSYSRLEEAIKNNDERLIRAGWVRPGDPFEFSMMDIRWLRIRPGETATSRTVEYRGYTCVTDANNGRPVANEPFVITQAGEASIQRSSNEFGCLDWVGAITHPYYKPENLYFRDVLIRNVASGYERKLTLAINPWDDKFTFGVDRRLMDASYFRRISERLPPDSRFFLAGFQYTTLRFRYEIDEFMNLRVKKTVLMTLEPRVVRYSSIVLGRNATEKLRDGIYLMKIALQKDYYDPARDGVTLARVEVPRRDASGRPIMMRDARGQLTGDVEKVPAFRPIVGDRREKPLEYITTQTKLVRVQDGKIITPVTFSMRDLRLMRIRKFFFVQFETIDEKMLSTYNFLEGRQKELFEQHRRELENSREALNGALARQPGDALAPSDEAEAQRMVDARQRLLEQNQRNMLFATMNDLMRRLGQIFMNHGGDGVVGFDNQTALQALFRYGGRRPLTDEELTTIEQNDFTMIGLNPLADLEPLIDRDSGLSPRTFVGPLTLINNTNSSAMVPTDVIDICQSTDCEDVMDVVQRQPGWIAADNSAYENSRFYGSINHFRNVQVDSLIERSRDLEIGYQMENRLNGQIYSYLEDFNLFFVSLRDEELFRVKPQCATLPRVEGNTLTPTQLDRAVEPCLEKTTDRSISKQEFLRMSNHSSRRRSSPLTEESIKSFIREGRLTFGVAARLCSAMVPLVRASLERRPELNVFMRENFFSDPTFDEGIQSQCSDLVSRATQGATGDQLSPAIMARLFSLEKRVRVRQTGQYRFKGGKSINVNVARNVSVSLASSTSIHFGFDILNVLTFGRLNGAKLNFNMDRRRQNQQGTSITEQTFLVMQSATFDIELLKYEECALIRFAPEFLGRMVRRRVPGYVGARAQHRGLREAISGVMICSGEEESQPQPIRERYYYFTQHFTEGDMLDQGDIYNHPWLLSIRGVRDMRAFLYLLHQQEGGNWPDLFDPRLYFTLAQDEEWVFNQMAGAYTRMLPTFPGLYTVLSEREADQVTSFPHTTNAADSFAIEDVDPRVNDGVPEPLRERMQEGAPP